MKNLLFLAFMILCVQTGFSQEEENVIPPYKQNRKLPAFEIQQVNNKTFNTSRLKKNTPVIIMFFSPGCDHCMHQFESMRKRISELKGFQIIMATFQPLEELAEFNKKYNIAKYPNIVTGRDSAYFLPPFYHIRNFPYFAFYDKTGSLKAFLREILVLTIFSGK